MCSNLFEKIMNINLNNIITISVNEGVDIEKLNIRYVRPYRRPSAFSNNHEKDPKTSSNGRSKSEKHNSKGEMEGKSNSSANMTTVASKVSPPAMSPSRPQLTFYFGQNQEPSGDDGTARKQSAVDKVVTGIMRCI